MKICNNRHFQVQVFLAFKGLIICLAGVRYGYFVERFCILYWTLFAVGRPLIVIGLPDYETWPCVSHNNGSILNTMIIICHVLFIPAVVNLFTC